MNYNVFVADDESGKHVVIIVPYQATAGVQQTRQRLKNKGYSNVRVLTSVDRAIFSDKEI